jgi:hypothetical protein
MNKKINEPNDEPWIETFTGLQFHLLNPRPEEICIEDIAHALSLQCRFTGHTRKFYSVAEHSYYVSLVAALPGLLHDASEAYIGDLSRPLKHFTPVGPEYLRIESNIERAIALKFELPWPPSFEVLEIVKKADNSILYTEKDQLMTKLDWDVDWTDDPEKPRMKVQLVGYRPEVIEKIFLQRFFQLT